MAGPIARGTVIVTVILRTPTATSPNIEFRGRDRPAAHHFRILTAKFHLRSAQ